MINDATTPSIAIKQHETIIIMCSFVISIRKKEQNRTKEYKENISDVGEAALTIILKEITNESQTDSNYVFIHYIWSTY